MALLGCTSAGQRVTPTEVQPCEKSVWRVDRPVTPLVAAKSSRSLWVNGVDSTDAKAKLDQLNTYGCGRVHTGATGICNGTHQRRVKTGARRTTGEDNNLDGAR